MKLAPLACAAIALLALTQCSKKADDRSSVVALTVTPAAEQALSAAGKTIEVSGTYYGAPVEASAAKVNEAGQIDLGEDIVNAGAKGGEVHLTGIGIDEKLVTKDVIKDGAVMVHAVAYSDTSAPNLLSCSTFDGTLADAQKSKIQIACDVKK